MNPWLILVGFLIIFGSAYFTRKGSRIGNWIDGRNRSRDFFDYIIGVSTIGLVIVGFLVIGLGLII